MNIPSRAVNNVGSDTNNSIDPENYLFDANIGLSDLRPGDTPFLTHPHPHPSHSVRSPGRKEQVYQLFSYKWLQELLNLYARIHFYLFLLLRRRQFFCVAPTLLFFYDPFPRRETISQHVRKNRFPSRLSRV